MTRGQLWAGAATVPMVVLLTLPFLSLTLALSPAELVAGTQHRLFWPALALSLRTSVVSLALIVILGTPLAWWIARYPGRLARVLEMIVDLPVVIPPAVLGVALLAAYGRQGLVGPPLEAIGVRLPFTTAAVVMAQTIVAAPFFLHAAVAAFRQVDPDLILVARTLGHSRRQTFTRVVVPLALPGMLSGAALSWARAIGEFGATLLFAGSLMGRTQTMPLAIFQALETDVRAAIALALILAAIGVVLLLGLRSLRREVTP